MKKEEFVINLVRIYEQYMAVSNVLAICSEHDFNYHSLLDVKQHLRIEYRNAVKRYTETYDESDGLSIFIKHQSSIID